MSLKRSSSTPVRTKANSSASPANPTIINPVVGDSSNETLRSSRRESRSPTGLHRWRESIPVRRKGDDVHIRGRQAALENGAGPPHLPHPPPPVGLATSTTPSLATPVPNAAVPSKQSEITRSIQAEKKTQDTQSSRDRDMPSYTPRSLTTPVSETTSLQELAHIVRLSRYQERKRATVRIRLERTLISTALNARLIRCGELGHRNLVDNFRRDDKDAFATLYNAIQDVRKSCDELRRYALLEPDMEAQSSPVLGSSECLDPAAGTATPTEPLRPVTSFLDDIAPSSRDLFLSFLVQLRTNPDYLAARLNALSGSELNGFLNAHKGLETIESVLPTQSRSSSRGHPGISARNSMTDVERLLSFQRHDPLSILIHTCFANSAGPESGEDQRRTDVWATALARLISEPKSTSEHFLICILNSWTMMRDWAGKSNMEWYLMKILADGAFLLDRADDQHGTRFNLANWNRSDDAAADKFYARAVNDLFELVDHEDGTGIPDGLLELGTAVLKKLDGKYVDNTSKWLVWRCLFFVFFLGVIVYPESHGMLSQYYITPYAREKILKKVAVKAHEYVSSMWTSKPAAGSSSTIEIPANIKTHIESILDRFQGGSQKTYQTKLQPAKSVTSLRETAEVHPFLIICPADISTLINALFPERRPLSSASGGGLRSGAPSFSGLSAISQPVSMVNPKNSMETGSVIGTSVSSVFSDASIPKDELQDTQTSKTVPERFSPTNETEQRRKSNKYEDDGFQLRLALHEMKRTLGSDVVRGTCHPCADRWAVVFISADGKSLTTRMTYDLDSSTTNGDAFGDNESISTDAEAERSHDELRESILKLVEEFEIPQNPDVEEETVHFTNRTSPEGRGNPENHHPIMPELAHLTFGAALSQTPNLTPDATCTPQNSVLINMLEAACSQAKAQSDFISSHVYWDTLCQLQSLPNAHSRKCGYADLIHSFSREPRGSIRESTCAIEEYEAWLVWLKQSQERVERLINRMMRRVRAIRDKMWYVADVRNSTEYAYARDTCQGLKFMGMPQRWSSSQGSWATGSRGPGPAYLHWTESQVVEILAATKSQGGPNKLTDEQAEVTSEWLKRKGVENLCRGEERIHRFCCELDKYIAQLVGENIRDAPVLWSSELYRRDKMMYDQKKNHAPERRQTGEDNASFISDSSRSFRNPAHMRNLSGSHRGGPPFDIPRQGQLRHAVPFSDVLDGPDHHFDRTSPVQGTESSDTFWSPFQPATSSGYRAYSPTTSMTNLSAKFSASSQHVPVISPSSISMGRPETMASFNETIYHHTVDGDKVSFLAQIKQTLTGLLISDLGSLVMARGSETDIWFKKLGQECLDRREALDQHALRKSALKEKVTATKVTPKPRALEKKKSFGDLRGAGDSANDREMVDTEAAAMDATSSRGDGGNINQSQPALAKGPSEFPFKKAYKRLLTMFCVHPNPYVKLSALRELEQLIVAAIMTRKKRSRNNNGQSQSSNRGYPTRPSSGTTKDAISPETITTELLKLFRDASLRPKTLFRDLQLISALVPASVLDKPEQGQAFWNAGLAALQLKSEVCRTMIEMADEVFAAHTNSRSVAYNEMEAQPAAPSATGTPPPPSSKYNLYDVGRMWTITAKEGYPAAQRELALFYLSNPEFVDRTTLPLSKPQEVFKPAVMATFRRNEKGRSANNAQTASGGGTAIGTGADGGGAAPGNQGSASTVDDARNDPALMCVAIHWMEAAQSGGDGLAISFLHQNGYYDVPGMDSKTTDKNKAGE